MPSAHVLQGACLGAHGSATGSSSTAVSANAGGSTFDAIRPTIGGSAMGDRQAGDLELNAVDGGGGRHRVRCCCEYCSRSDHQMMGVPSESVTVP